jgi:hypothetical protein
MEFEIELAQRAQTAERFRLDFYLGLPLLFSISLFKTSRRAFMSAKPSETIIPSAPAALVAVELQLRP